MLVHLCSQGIKVTKKDQNSLVLVLLKKYEKKNIQKTVLFWTNLSINIIHQKVQKSNVFLQKNQ